VVPCPKHTVPITHYTHITHAHMSNEPGNEIEDNFKLSNRGNKLIGGENPNSFRPKIWIRRNMSENENENENDFEVLKCSIISCNNDRICFLDL